MVNKTTLVGNVGDAPEIKTIANGLKLAIFSLATSEIYKDTDGNKKTDTEWHNIVIWGKLADIVEKYVTKGSLLYLEGKLKTQSWDKDGVRHYKTSVVCNEMKMLSKKES